MVKKGAYSVVLNTDNPDFGGYGLTDDTITACYRFAGLWIHHLLVSAKEA